MSSKVETRKKALLAAIFLVALAAMSVSAMVVRSAAVTTCTVTVEKSNAPIEDAAVTLYEATREWYGLYYDRGDLVAVNMTESDGTCQFSNLDDTKFYQAIITYDGMTYQANFEGDSTVDINLGATEEVRGNLYMGAVGATIGIIALIVFGYIKFTNRSPVKIGAN